MNKITVLIVDDSASVRSVLRAVLEQEPQILVCGEVADAYEARDAIKKLNPDVITLDVEMPKMDGVTFLRNLMRLHPVPTIMISSLTKKGAEVTVEALALGAVDYIHKPKASEIDSISNDIISKVIAAAKTNVTHIASGYLKETQRDENRGDFIRNRLIAIGASTGGIPAIEHLISGLPSNCPPVVIVQHISENFSGSLAARIDRLYNVNIYEACDGQHLEPGSVYLAPGNDHLEVFRQAGGYHCKLHKGALVNRHRPSVDTLFESVAKVAKGNASAALLTGMGKDGAKGLLALKKSGCFTVIQDEATSVVWGMPGAAAALGAADKTVSINRISTVLLNSCRVEGGYHVH